MSENYKFVRNVRCEYFPCHKIEDESEFNCLFCFCPLYMLKGACGGHFKYTNGFKDCSDCILPHSKNAHTYIMSKMKMVSEIASEQK